jgi:2-polyprenyl-3-methyl-5-hydroxy-6-metoxy-1,4-benzoquinol methylase
MLNLSQRSNQKELLDADNIPFADIAQNMQELNVINTWLGGHGITIKGFQQFLIKKNKSTPLVICEIGCGGGDNLQAIYTWANKNNIAVEFIGIDYKAECIDYAKKQYPNLPATWLVTDYKQAKFNSKPDIIFSSLFCHHFSNTELAQMMQWQAQNTKLGFFINDLHRNIIAYYSIKWITALFSKSYLVKSDAAISVTRGFSAKEWIDILQVLPANTWSINWKWAFRHLIVYKHDAESI